jgi:hypothetical protein
VLTPEVREHAVAALRRRIDHGPVAADEQEAFLRALLAAIRMR